MTKVAILETDQPMPSVAEKHGSYGSQFQRLLLQGGLDLSAVLKKYDVVNKQEYPDLAGLDAILLTGSRYSAYEDAVWILKLVDFTRKAIEVGVKVVGICFGHQIVARALGVQVAPNEKGWELSALKIELTEKGQQVFPELRNGISIMQMHRDIVTSLPPDTELLASTEVCGIQGFYRENAIFTLQGHPEFVADLVAVLIHTREEVGILTESESKDALRRVNDRNDGPVVAKAMVRFMQGY
jgi:GMP synthase-like glutamine amidotransferase